MSDLTEFLKARLDEDKRLARRANTCRRWTAVEDAQYGPQVRVGQGDIDDPGPEWCREVNYQVWHCDDEQDDCQEEAQGWIAEAQHIARHDPVRVQNEVEAKRRIVELHDAVMLHRADGGAAYYDTVLVCRTCGGTDAYFADGTPAPNRPALHPCPTLRLLALPYAEHPDCREQWLP